MDSKTRTAEDFQHYINDCLSTASRKLTENGKEELGMYIGEILSNAEDHSQENLWYVMGYLDTQSRPYVCSLAVVNFGLPYAKSFMNLPADDYARIEADKYVQKHHKTGGLSKELLYPNPYMGYHHRPFEPENLFFAQIMATLASQSPDFLKNHSHYCQNIALAKF